MATILNNYNSTYNVKNNTYSRVEHSNDSLNLKKTECTGYESHYWRKICKNCRCSKEDHVHNLNEKCKNNCNKMINNNELSQFEWYPKGVRLDLFERYINSIPIEKRPIKNTIGAEHRRRQMDKQLPMHDFELTVCDSLSNEHEIEKFNKFIDRYEKNSIGLGQIDENFDLNKSCHQCNQKIIKNDVIIRIKHDNSIIYHANCFKCTKCDQLLVDLIYFYKKQSIYCGRHFAELIRQRCAACDELIFAKEYTKAENQFWHIDHFCCWKCDKPLGGQKYAVLESKPYCNQCYELNFAKTCDSCHQKISSDSTHLTFNNISWHSNSTCFSCFTCRTSLIGKKFIFKNSYVFCSIECKRRIIPKNSNKIGHVVQL